MIYRLWRILGRRFWLQLESRWQDKDGKHWYGRWQQKKDEIRHYTKIRCEEMIT